MTKKKDFTTMPIVANVGIREYGGNRIRDLINKKPVGTFPDPGHFKSMMGGSERYRPGVNRDFMGLHYYGYGGHEGSGYKDHQTGGAYNTPLHGPMYGQRRRPMGKRGVIQI